MKSWTKTIGLAAAATCLAGYAQAQTFETIATEDFEGYALGGLGGLPGTSPVAGWFGDWFSGGGGTDATVIAAPAGFGGSNAVETTANNGGSFRSPKTGPWTPTAASGFNFGGNDSTTTIWVSFTAQRAPGSTAQYGGLSLHTVFVGEKLFLGSNFQSNEWGIGPIGTVAGSNVDTRTRLVYKIEYGPGDETASLWIDPGVPHPTTTPDLTGTVPSHDWNEIRLQSGEPVDGADPFGYYFDDIVIECQDCTPPDILSDTDQLSLSAGGTQNLQLFGGLENEGLLYLTLGSASGTSPGLPAGTGTLPLNLDAYLLFTLNNTNSGILSNSFNTLDLDGKGFPAFNLPAGSNPSLAGTTINHAYVVLDLTLTIFKVSTAEPVLLIS